MLLIVLMVGTLLPVVMEAVTVVVAVIVGIGGYVKSGPPPIAGAWQRTFEQSPNAGLQLLPQYDEPLLHHPY
jgi:hypothetical protein